MEFLEAVSGLKAEISYTQKQTHTFHIHSQTYLNASQA